MFKKCILLILICLLSTGCWDKIEINNRGFVLIMGVDKFDAANGESVSDKNKFTVSMSFADLGSGENNQSNVTMQSKKYSGETLLEAMETANNFSSKNTYFGQTKALLISEDILKDEELLAEVLGTLEKNPEINLKLIVLATKGTAFDVVEAICLKDQNNGLYIWDFYKNNKKYFSTTTELDFENLLIDLRKNGSALIPSIYLDEDEITISGSAMIKDNVLKDFLDVADERNLLFLNGNKIGGSLSTNYKDSSVTLLITSNSSNMKFKEINDKLICTAEIVINGSIDGYLTNKESLFADDALKTIETNFAYNIKKDVMKSLDALQNEYDCDALNLSYELYKKNPHLYGKYKDEAFSKMEFEIDAKVNISGIGMTK